MTGWMDAWMDGWTVESFISNAFYVFCIYQCPWCSIIGNTIQIRYCKPTNTTNNTFHSESICTSTSLNSHRLEDGGVNERIILWRIWSFARQRLSQHRLKMEWQQKRIWAIPRKQLGKQLFQLQRMLTKGIPVTTTSITEENSLFDKVSPSRHAKKLLQGVTPVKASIQKSAIRNTQEATRRWVQIRAVINENSERDY
jgi:hypothetical protein